MIPFLYKGLWRFEHWAEYYDIPCPNNLHNWLITIWVLENARFGDKGVKMIHIDWRKVAMAYKRHLLFEEQRQKQRELLAEVFGAWRRSTCHFQQRKVRQMGMICANIAAARARGSKEPEWFLSLI